MAYIQQMFDWAGTKPPDIQAVLDRLAEARGAELGAVFTKREVVEFVLDLAGYRAEEDLTHASLLEPSCGRGDFLLIAMALLLRDDLLFDPAGIFGTSPGDAILTRERLDSVDPLPGVLHLLTFVLFSDL